MIKEALAIELEYTVIEDYISDEAKEKYKEDVLKYAYFLGDIDEDKLLTIDDASTTIQFVLWCDLNDMTPNEELWKEHL